MASSDRAVFSLVDVSLADVSLADVSLTDLVEVKDKRVHVVHGANAFVDGGHDTHCVFGQFRVGCHLVSRFQLFEFGEEFQQFRVLIE